jgi:hypothetical protein
MAKIKTHCEDTLIILGKGYDFIEVHEWLDFYAKKYPPWCYLEYHRAFRHNAWGIEQIVNKWDFFAGEAGKIHLVRDVQLYVSHKQMHDIKYDEIAELYEKALKYLPPRKKEERTDNG